MRRENSIAPCSQSQDDERHSRRTSRDNWSLRSIKRLHVNLATQRHLPYSVIRTSRVSHGECVRCAPSVKVTARSRIIYTRSGQHDELNVNKARPCSQCWLPARRAMGRGESFQLVHASLTEGADCVTRTLFARKTRYAVLHRTAICSEVRRERVALPDWLQTRGLLRRVADNTVLFHIKMLDVKCRTTRMVRIIVTIGISVAEKRLNARSTRTAWNYFRIHFITYYFPTVEPHKYNIAHYVCILSAHIFCIPIWKNASDFMYFSACFSCLKY